MTRHAWLVLLICVAGCGTHATSPLDPELPSTSRSATRRVLDTALAAEIRAWCAVVRQRATAQVEKLSGR